jgi:signal transduction histidine kinase
VAIALAETSADIRLVVSDDGPGVPEEHRDRIFDRFARVEGSRVRGTGSTGTGLGLSIAQAIAERHGGSIFVEGTSSTPCDGARFVVVLPRAV